jgi:2-polyprenyl-3-methyl-5-hydroxy-6-metoxy-1,4-benzoquinol methylase
LPTSFEARRVPSVFKTCNGVLPTRAEVEAVFVEKYGGTDAMGPMQRVWRRAGYFAPDDVYEALVAKLVAPGCDWLDVGCGRNIFPDNERLAASLARRCGFLLGVDPDATIEENDFVHEKACTVIEDVTIDRSFDLITLRMVAEHIVHPEAAMAAVARLTRVGGKVVVLTINRWSPVSLAAWLIPHRLHHPIKRKLWGSESKDTFPVAYRMNTRGELRRWFERSGFRELAFARLDDCRTFHQIWPLHRLELAARGLCAKLGKPYPEHCLLGVYELVAPRGDAT